MGVSVKAMLTEEEYLHTSFPGVDQEFREGELLERGLPDHWHATAQANFTTVFGIQRKAKGLSVGIGDRLRVRPGRVMIPDVCVFWPDPPAERYAEHRPFVVLEILSQDDRMSEVLEKLREYVDWGVPYVLLIDPRKRAFYTCGSALRQVDRFVFPELGIEIAPEDIFD